MPDARVTDVAAIADFRAALAGFSGEVLRALADLEIETHRAVEWFAHNRPQYWEAELRRAQDAVARAKVDLANSRTFKSIGDFTPSCDQEKKILEAAKRRLEHAQRKLQAVKLWSRAVQQAVEKFRGPIQQLMMVLDGDIPRAMALLERMSVALENYAATSAPAALKWEELAGTADDRSMARSSDDVPTAAEESKAGNQSNEELPTIHKKAAAS